ncbi:MAG: NUDIX hydrolase [Methanomethylophilus sp.]|jgi:8-oxo-dGTP diphosphatase
MSPDTNVTAYAVAFCRKGFLMVRNPKRGGWEMPGGHVRAGETPAEGAAREFFEESGFRIRVFETRDLGHCYVCSAVIADEPVDGNHEMEHAFFTELPEELSFAREEYLDTIPWALKSLRAKGVPGELPCNIL